MIASQVFYSSEVPVYAPVPSSNFTPVLVPPQPAIASPASTVSIGSAIAALVAAKRVSNRREVYCNEMRRFLGTFARGRENAPLSSITAEHIEAWLSERQYRPASHLSAIGRISTLFQFAKKKRWVQVNPAEAVEKPYTDWETPFILSPEQCEKLLRHCQREWPDRLLYLSLSRMG